MGTWRNGLFGCFDNCGLCVITFFLPCVTAGHNAEHVGENCFLYGFLSMLWPIGVWSRAKIRGMIREQRGIDGSFCDDCILHWFCAVCAIIQEGQELQSPGVNAMARE